MWKTTILIPMNNWIQRGKRIEQLCPKRHAIIETSTVIAFGELSPPPVGRNREPRMVGCTTTRRSPNQNLPCRATPIVPIVLQAPTARVQEDTTNITISADKDVIRRARAAARRQGRSLDDVLRDTLVRLAGATSCDAIAAEFL